MPGNGAVTMLRQLFWPPHGERSEFGIRVPSGTGRKAHVESKAPLGLEELLVVPGESGICLSTRA